jgi:hypothetical protein
VDEAYLIIFPCKMSIIKESFVLQTKIRVGRQKLSLISHARNQVSKPSAEVELVR